MRAQELVVVPFTVARLRAEYASHVGDPEWEEDIRRLHDLCPEFAELWARREVAGPEIRYRTFDHPDVGEMNVAMTELAVSAVDGLRIQVSTPTDAETWAKLPLTREHATEATEATEATAKPDAFRLSPPGPGRRARRTACRPGRPRPPLTGCTDG